MSETTRAYPTRARAAALAAAKENVCGLPSRPLKSLDLPRTNNAPKRALGDITNFAPSSLHPSHVPSKKSAAADHDAAHSVAATKIRRGPSTKAVNSHSGAARRSKNAYVLAAAKMSVKEAAASECVSDAAVSGNSPMSSIHVPAELHSLTSSLAGVAPRRTSGRLAKRAAAAAAAMSKAMSLHESDDSSAMLHCQRLPVGVYDIDEEDRNNHLAIAEFAAEIHQNFLAREILFMADAAYMANQQDITIKMRAILVDWLVDVHQKFKLQPETLHLTINIIDRFLAVTPVMRRKLQLVGVTAMLIASKYEEIYAPETADFVYISDKAYSKEEILSMEAVILNVLKFDVTVPSSLTFMHRCLKAMAPSLSRESRESRESQQLVKQLAHYCVELSLQNSDMLRFRPSVRAAAACLLACKALCVPLEWSATMCHFSGGWSAADLAECERALLRLLEHERDPAGTNKLTAIKRKFGSAKYLSVSTRPIPDDDMSLPIGMDICPSE